MRTQSNFFTFLRRYLTPADHRPGKRAPTVRKLSSATVLDTGALYTPFERDCDHTGLLSSSQPDLRPTNCGSDQSRARDGETDRRTFSPVPECPTETSLTMPSSQDGIRVTPCSRRRTAAPPQRIAGILMVKSSTPWCTCLYRQLLTHLVGLAGDTQNPEDAHAQTHPDVAPSGEGPLAYGIPTAIRSTDTVPTSAMKMELADISGKILCISNGACSSDSVFLSGG